VYSKKASGEARPVNGLSPRKFSTPLTSVSKTTEAAEEQEEEEDTKGRT
jgi:hypothetical protein